MVGISWYFFKKQAKDLESKVLPLEQVITLVAHYLQREGLIKDLEFDEKEALKGYTQTIEVGLIFSGESLRGGELTHEDDQAANTTDEQP